MDVTITDEDRRDLIRVLQSDEMLEGLIPAEYLHLVTAAVLSVVPGIVDRHAANLREQIAREIEADRDGPGPRGVRLQHPPEEWWRHGMTNAAAVARQGFV